MSGVDFDGTQRFELIGAPLGMGGFGVVYEAFDRHNSTRVALKLLRDGEGAALLKFKEEFRRFARLSIDHENLVKLHELLKEGHHWFFTMELIRGLTLLEYTRPSNRTAGAPRRWDERHRHLNEGRVRSSFAQLARALSFIHSFDVVHCDIKPSNVLVCADGRVVVLDFGLAAEPSGDRIAGVSSPRTMSVVIATPAYMAPEQATSDPVTAAADWYSVGLVLYEALTGRRPFSGSNLEVIQAKQWDTPPDPRDVSSDIPEDLAELSVALLNPTPGGRPSGEQVLRCLNAARLRPKPPSVVRPVPEVLVGRGSHLRMLKEALETSKGGKTVVAFVSGLSGMGKTALIKHFLRQERAEDPDLLALTSRCYECESMPYKAIDPLIDTLAQHLKPLPDLEVARVLPRDASILARAFPVLLQVEEVGRASAYSAGTLDSVALRQRAGEALRDLFHRLGHHPLVLTIDDAQWGDADSASILQQVLRPPDGPPLLLIVAYRSEDAAGVSLLGALRQLIRDASGPEVRDIEVGSLSMLEAQELATLLTAGRRDAGAHANTIARESGGNAFFIHELAQYNATVGSHTTLEAVVLERLRTLPDAARRFVTAAALSAQPLPSSVGRAAAELEPEDPEPFQVLRASRLVRTQGGPEEPTFEAYHDRIREAVVAQLTDQNLQQWHRRLATAWESSPLARLETLVTHFEGAGDNAKTHRYAQAAAQNAEKALAFDRAAKFYQLLVRLETERTMQLVWHAKLGEALANAGRGHEAALSFLNALDEPLTARSIQLERRAATELIRAGYLDQASEVLDTLLPKVGVRAPRSDLRALATLLGYRLLLVLRGYRFRQRPESEVPEEILRRIDVLMSISEPLCFTSLIRGQALNAQGAWYALQAGEPLRAVRALTSLVASSSVAGTRARHRTAGLLAAAQRQAASIGDQWTIGRTTLAEGISLKLSGQFERAIQTLERAIDIFAECQGVTWEVETAQTLIHDSLLWIGEWNRLSRELPARRQAAEQRGDLYSAAYGTSRTSPVLLMAADRIEQAREEVTNSLKLWTTRYFHLQRRTSICTWVDLGLYSGDPSDADERLTAAWPALRGMLLGFQFGRIEMVFYRARIALALAAGQGAGALDRAQRDARRLTKERAPWAEALARLVRATVARGRGKTNLAIHQLEAAETALRACHMNHYAAAARYRRGGLVGGPKGSSLVRDATEWMQSQQMVNPARIADLLAPGPW